MTIDLDFFSKGHIVLSVNMCAVNFNNKVCEKISNEELDGAFTRDEETEDEIFTDKSFIKKIWNTCLEHGYISQNYNSLCLWVDKMILPLSLGGQDDTCVFSV
jgi:hypothetical protein